MTGAEFIERVQVDTGGRKEGEKKKVEDRPHIPSGPQSGLCRPSMSAIVQYYHSHGQLRYKTSGCRADPV